MTHPRNTYIFISVLVSLLLTFVPEQAAAQYKRKKQQPQVTDTIPLFRGFAVSADLVGVVQKMTGDYGQIGRVSCRERV